MSRSSGIPRRASVPAQAKINLDLRVLGKRADGYHELRTIFQTISLRDTLEIAFTPGRKTEFELHDDLGIPDNLVSRAARLAMEAMGASGRVGMRLTKRIPMGAGLGGGSSDAAAVLLALPALVGRPLGLDALAGLAARLGSDVPFFLLGGTAVGIGRGTELFPLPDAPAQLALLVAPGVHVDTTRAYAELSPGLTTESQQNKIFSFQSHTWNSIAGGPGAPTAFVGRNDFEAVVFARHGRLADLKRGLIRAGASFAMMTGSGSALYGLFSRREDVSRALRRPASLLGLRAEEKAFRISLIGRARYRSMWNRALAEHTVPGTWPPRSRYIR
jgi:4-diphosphocytidyl-2-C-methyl-D-erythritol kinase